MADHGDCTDDDPSETRDSQSHHPSCDKYWWHVNKSGFPVEETTWERMWDYAVRVHPDGEQLAQSIRGKQFGQVAIPTVPIVTSSCSPPAALVSIQRYLQQLQYNHTGTQFFDVKKYRALIRLMETAKEIIRESLPIKCLEAVMVALYLTLPLTTVQRFTIGFKSCYKQTYYRHVVLGVHHASLYGALGLSRRQDLMYKPLEYKCLSDLIQDFVSSYEKYGHKVIRVKLSAPVVHDLHSCEKIHWKYMVLPLQDMDKVARKRIIDKYSRLMRTYL